MIFDIVMITWLILLILMILIDYLAEKFNIAFFQSDGKGYKFLLFLGFILLEIGPPIMALTFFLTHKISITPW